MVDRNLGSKTFNGKGTSGPLLLLLAAYVLSFYYSGTTPVFVFSVRSLVACAFLIIALTGRIAFPENYSLPIIFFFAYLFHSLVKTAWVVSPWPNLQWSMNILVVFLFFLVMLSLFKERLLSGEDLVKGAIFFSVLELAIQLVQKFWFGIQRPPGTFFNPNFLGGFHAMAFLVLVGKLFTNKIVDGRAGRWILLSLIPLVGLVLTASRGAALALAAGVFVVSTMRFGLRGIAIFVLLGVLFLLVPNPIRDRLFHLKDVYGFSRLKIYTAGLNVFADNPMGIGLGNFKYYYNQYAMPIYGAVALYGKKAKTLHSEHIQVLVEGGILGMLLYLGFLVSAGVRLMLSPPKRPNPFLSSTASGVLIAFLAHASVDSVYHSYPLVFSAVVVLAWFFSETEVDWNKFRFSNSLSRSLVLTFFSVFVVYSAGTLVSTLALDWGKRALEGKKYDEAVTLVRYGVLADPLSGKSCERAAAVNFKVYVYTGKSSRYREAVEFLERSLSLQSRAFWVMKRLAFVTEFGLRRGMYSDVEPGVVLQFLENLYGEILELNPYDVFTMTSLAKLLQDKGNESGSVKLLRKAITTEPNYAEGYYLLGKWHKRKGNIKECLRLYRRALNIYKLYSAKRPEETYARFLVELGKEEVAEIEATLRRWDEG